MHLGKFEEAVNLYREIVRFNFPNEDKVLSEIFNFNKNMVEENPDYYQFYFILGYLYYKKVVNYPEAYSYFEQFVTRCKDDKMRFLLKIASNYLEDLTLRMNLK
jgi:tetratricopeptide (TPR) repeat protein